MKSRILTSIVALVASVVIPPQSVAVTSLGTQTTRIEMEPISQPIVVVTLWQMKQMAKAIGEKRVKALYRSQAEWLALHELWDRESKWDYTADNPHSSAYGIPQLLNMAKDTTIVEQINLGLKYIAHRYERPTLALAFHNRNGWY